MVETEKHLTAIAQFKMVKEVIFHSDALLIKETSSE